MVLHGAKLLHKHAVDACQGEIRQTDKENANSLVQFVRTKHLLTLITSLHYFQTFYSKSKGNMYLVVQVGDRDENHVFGWIGLCGMLHY